MPLPSRSGRGLAGWVLLALTGACTPPPPPARPVDVVVMVIDALRGDALGASGYPLPTTPHLDALAAAGLALPAFAPATWTVPSIASLFTSVYPSRHGLLEVVRPVAGRLRSGVLAARFTTLAERFQGAGYATGAFINQVHLKPGSGFEQGFETYRRGRGRDAFAINRWFAEWLPAVGGRRLFAYVHYLDVHWPYDSRLPETARAFGPTSLAPALPGRGAAAQRWFAALGPAAPQALAALRARYDREVSLADAAVGQLVDLLAASGRLDDTVLVVTADHGEGFGEHGFLQHGYAPYDELLRVPLVLRVPDWLRARLGSRLQPGPRTPLETEAGPAADLPPVSLVDLGPTLAEWAGLPPGAEGEGVALSRLLAAGRNERVVYAETPAARAVRDRRHKLIRFAGGREEFYDLIADRAERHPAPCDAACSALAAHLDAFAQRSAPAAPAAGEPLRPEEIEELKALGYLAEGDGG